MVSSTVCTESQLKQHNNDTNQEHPTLNNDNTYKCLLLLLDLS